MIVGTGAVNEPYVSWCPGVGVLPAVLCGGEAGAGLAAFDTAHDAPAAPTSLLHFRASLVYLREAARDS